MKVNGQHRLDSECHAAGRWDTHAVCDEFTDASG